MFKKKRKLEIRHNLNAIFEDGQFTKYVCNISNYLLYSSLVGTVVKVLCYKSEVRWFVSRWCHWNFS